MLRERLINILKEFLYIVQFISTVWLFNSQWHSLFLGHCRARTLVIVMNRITRFILLWRVFIFVLLTYEYYWVTILSSKAWLLTAYKKISETILDIIMKKCFVWFNKSFIPFSTKQTDFDWMYQNFWCNKILIESTRVCLKFCYIKKILINLNKICLSASSKIKHTTCWIKHFSPCAWHCIKFYYFVMFIEKLLLYIIKTHLFLLTLCTTICINYNIWIVSDNHLGR